MQFQHQAPPQSWGGQQQYGGMPPQSWGAQQQQYGGSWGGGGMGSMGYPDEGGMMAQQYASPPPPEPVVPQGRDGFVRLSNRVFVVPEGTSTATVVDELNEVHSMGISEKVAMPLDPAEWTDENAFSNAIIKAFRVKGGKPGAKFWKGVRESVMKLCGTQDLLMLLPAPAEPPAEQAQSLLKNLFGASDTKAAADSLVGLKSGKVLCVMVGWDEEAVRSWALLAEDPIPTPSAQELARRNDPDDLSQYYARNAPPRQLPPRQRQGQGLYGSGAPGMGGPGGPPRGWGNGPPQPGYGYGGHNNGRAAWNGEQQQQHWNGGGGYGDMPMNPQQQQQQWNGGYGYGQGDGGQGGGYGPGGGYGGGLPGANMQQFGGHGMSPQGGHGFGGHTPTGGLLPGHLPSSFGGGTPPQQPGLHGLNGYGGGGLPSMGGYDGQSQQPQQPPPPPGHFGNGLASSARSQGGAMPGMMRAGCGGSCDSSLPAGLAASVSQFGMSANAPAFTPGGGACGSGAVSASAGCGGQGASFEQESLRAAAENLWADVNTSAGAPAPRFSVPDLNKVPSMQTIEAESMRAAAAGLWDSGGSVAPASAPSEDLLGMPPLPSGMLGGSGGPGADELGLCGADLLAGLRLDGASEPSGL